MKAMRRQSSLAFLLLMLDAVKTLDEHPLHIRRRRAMDFRGDSSFLTSADRGLVNVFDPNSIKTIAARDSRDDVLPRMGIHDGHDVAVDVPLERTEVRGGMSSTRSQAGKGGTGNNSKRCGDGSSSSSKKKVPLERTEVRGGMSSTRSQAGKGGTGNNSKRCGDGSSSSQNNGKGGSLKGCRGRTMKGEGSKNRPSCGPTRSSKSKRSKATKTDILTPQPTLTTQDPYPTVAPTVLSTAFDSEIPPSPTPTDNSPTPTPTLRATSFIPSVIPEIGPPSTIPSLAPFISILPSGTIPSSIPDTGPPSTTPSLAPFISILPSGTSPPPTTSAPTEIEELQPPTKTPTTTPSLAPSISITEPTAAPVAPSLRYDITQQLFMPTEEQEVFVRAGQRWEQIVVGDIPDFPSSSLTVEPKEGCTYPDIIDDLYICGVIEPIDGSMGEIGQGRITFMRPDNFLPVAGEMVFDADDLDFIKGLGIWDDMVAHEMAHVMGFGYTWVDTGVTGPIDANCPYLGERANAVYQEISGCTTPVPLKNNGNPATKCIHWDEKCLAAELLTNVLNAGGAPISNITVASFEDIGYEVDYSAADPFGVEDLEASCVCRRRRNLEDGEDHSEGLQLEGIGDGHGRTLREPLREDLLQYAIHRGQGILRESRLEGLRSRMYARNDDAVYVGDQLIYIFMRQGNEIYSVAVTGEM